MHYQLERVQAPPVGIYSQVFCAYRQATVDRGRHSFFFTRKLPSDDFFFFIFYNLLSKPRMTSSTRSKKGGNQARPRPEKVRGGRVSKRNNKAPHRRVSLQENQSSTQEVRRNPLNKRTTPEIISSSEDDAYEHAGTDQDCSEGSGSPTDQDTPTRLALARRREAKGKHWEKITSRRLPGAKAVVVRPHNTPSSRLPSSSAIRSSPCFGRNPVATGLYSLSPATDPSLPPPSGPNRRFLSIDPLSSLGDMESSCVDTPRVRKNTVTGAERQLLDRARESILDYTLFRDPFPSALEFTGFIHRAWTESEASHDLRVEPSAESLNNVSIGRTKSI
jgi:hypothetical protein